MLGARLVDPPYLHFFIRVPLRDFLVAVKNYAERTEGPLGDVDAFSDEITQFFGKSLIGEYVFKRHPDKDDYQMAVRLFLRRRRQACTFSNCYWYADVHV